MTPDKSLAEQVAELHKLPCIGAPCHCGVGALADQGEALAASQSNAVQAAWTDAPLKSRKQMSVLEAVSAERKRQDEKWGGPVHDDTLTSHDWVAWMTRYTGRSVAYGTFDVLRCPLGEPLFHLDPRAVVVEQSEVATLQPGTQLRQHRFRRAPVC